MTAIRSEHDISRGEPEPTVTWRIAVIYLASFIGLAWISFIHPLQGFAITLWNPQPALAVALLLWSRGAVGWVFASLLLAELVNLGLPKSWAIVVAGAATQTLVYLALAVVLDRSIGRSLMPRTPKELLWIAMTVAVGAASSGLAYVSVLNLGGSTPTWPFHETVARYWVGEAVGMFITLPIIGIAMDRRQREDAREVLRGWRWWPIALVTIAMLWMMFRTPTPTFRVFSLLILPMIWSATRLGVPGAVLSIGFIQISLLIAAQLTGRSAITVIELQLLVSVIAATGLLIGLVVEERTRAFANLRRSLHYASAGQLASALAHELGQPLTALGAYAQACRDVVARKDAAIDPVTRAKLHQIASTMIADVQRTGEVMRRLRDFFRTGTTRLRRTTVRQLVDDAVALHARRAAVLGIRLDLANTAGHAEVEVDEVQIAVVLRNLIANAMDAVTATEGSREVRIRTIQAGPLLRVEVRDNGPGVPRNRLDRLFEGTTSEKPGGMGVGLGISRAIIETHGGNLWAEAGPGGRFAFTLPLAAPATRREEEEEEHATEDGIHRR